MHPHRALRSLPIAMATFLLVVGGSASAGVLPASLTITGTFSNPVSSGNIIDAATGAPTFYDNSSSVVVTGLGSNTLAWGSNTVTPPPPTQSTLTFTGATITTPIFNTPFTLGTITFTNGTSALNSLIFGIDLTLGTADGSITPLTTRVGIVTTANTSTDPAPNADFIGFDKFAATFNVFEGATASALLIGDLVGDPQFNLLDLELVPGNEANGFIGQGLPLPEPAPLALIALSLLAMAPRARRYLCS